MGVEVEKKYRLTDEQRARLPEALRAAGARLEGEEFETNTLYAGNDLDTTRAVLRLRRTDKRAVLTYKERGDVSASGVKRHREDETEVADADALHDILDALGYRPSLIYEKRRTTWHKGDAEIVIDELPFGSFMEIEAQEEVISELEEFLNLVEAESVAETYPDLVGRLGRRSGDVIESRFAPA